MGVLFYVKNCFLALLYSLVFYLCYVLFLSNHFKYIGFAFFKRPKSFLLLSLFISIAPILFYRGYKALSSVISTFLYLLLYIPIIVTFALGSKLPLTAIGFIQVNFLLGMCLLFLADRFAIKKPYFFGEKISYNFILFLTIGATIYMLIIYRQDLKFVSFEDVYIQRSATENTGKDIITRYLSSWLFSVLIPICLSYGLLSKKKFFFILGSGGCLVIYLATAAKSAIVLPLIYLVFFFLFSKNRLSKIFQVLIISLSVFMASLLLFGLNMASALVLSRTIGNAGLNAMAYYDFFSSHARTYYSHIGFVNLITNSYPYGQKGLGAVVGQYFWSDEMNANAHFWATDGIAAFGLPGIVIISFILFLFFILINAVTRGHNKLFAILCFLPFVLSLTNVSFFQSLWTGGGIYMIIFFSSINKNDISVDIEKN